MPTLDDIDGLGNSYEAKLHEAGIDSVNKLANSSVEEIEDAGIPSKRAKNFHNAAQRMGVLIQSGPEVEEQQSDKKYVTTGMQSFDSMLGGGWEPGFIYGVAGEHRAGKTQLMFQALTSAARFDGPAVYIETEKERFRASRIKSMCSKESTYKNIYKIPAHSLDQQRVAYDTVREEFDDVGLIIVDSFTAQFRLSGEFTGREDLPDRTEVISDHIDGIEQIQEEHDCPALLTLQVMGNPTAFDNSVPIWGGMMMEHAITAFILMKQSKGQLREAQLKGHPGLDDGDVTLKIKDSGVEAVD